MKKKRRLDAVKQAFIKSEIEHKQEIKAKGITKKEEIHAMRKKRGGSAPA